MSPSLARVLHEQRLQALVREAETVRDWPDGQDRMHEAQMLIREVMYRCAIQRISQDEESRIFSILAFAMSDDGMAWARKGFTARS
jgi:hypothetical protein